jgi:hypothetical protein
MRPYPNVQAYAGSDVFIDLGFLDRTLTAVVPATITVELDDLTNSVDMDGGPNSLNSAGSASGNYLYPAFSTWNGTSPWTLQLANTLMQMTYPYQGSQICKLKLQFTATDSITGNAFQAPNEIIIELIASPTVSGSF